MKSLKTAYLLWALGLFGCLGLHRFYLNKPKTGRLLLFTGGLLFIGSMHDLYYFSRMVKICNTKLQKKKLLQNIEKIKAIKNITVKEKNFESAAWYRDKEKGVLEEIEVLNTYLNKNHVF